MGLEPVVPMLWLLACFCFLCLLACFLLLVMPCDMPWSSLLTPAPGADVLPCAKAGAVAIKAATMIAGRVIFMKASLCWTRLNSHTPCPFHEWTFREEPREFRERAQGARGFCAS